MEYTGQQHSLRVLGFHNGSKIWETSVNCQINMFLPDLWVCGKGYLYFHPGRWLTRWCHNLESGNETCSLASQKMLQSRDQRKQWSFCKHHENLASGKCQRTGSQTTKQLPNSSTNDESLCWVQLLLPQFFTVATSTFHNSSPIYAHIKLTEDSGSLIMK